MKIESNSKKHLGLALTLAAVVSIFSGCGKKKGDNKDSDNTNPTSDVTDEKLIEAIDSSNPEVEVVVGDYEHMTPKATTNVNEVSKSFASSSILDMPKASSISVIYNTSTTSSVKASDNLLQNVINANKQLHTITVKDRSGKYLERDNDLLSTDGTKILIQKAGGFDCGEVYQISLNDADYLCFENRDPSIRSLTIEIEDDPSDASTYSEKTLKSITNVDLKKISNKKVKDEGGLYSFEYDESVTKFPTLGKGAVFYATEEGKPNSVLDFYGVYQSKKSKSDGKVIVFYETPQASDIYESLRLKNVVDMDLSDAEVLVTNDIAKKEFKRSSLAKGIANATSPYVNSDVKTITNVFSKFKIKVNINIVNNKLWMKFSAGISNYKLKDGLYLNVDFEYEKITEYSIDYDISLESDLVFPVGVDYKIKCIEETDELYSLKAALSSSTLPSTPSESDFVDAIASEIDAIQNNKNASLLSQLDSDLDLKASTSGSKTSFPIIAVRLSSLSPIAIKYNSDFYIDAGFQAMFAFSNVTHSKKVNFCFANVGGTDTDEENLITKSSNFAMNYAGEYSFEIGCRSSYGFSIFGLYDYLHIEGYAESYVKASAKGLLVADVSINTVSDQLAGFVGVDASIKSGVRLGLDFKVLIFTYNISKTLSDFTLLRIKSGTSLCDFSSRSIDSISLSKQTTSIDDTNVLYFDYFDVVALEFIETKLSGDDKCAILSGILWSNSLVEPAKTNTFKYEVLSHQADVEISEDGLIHIKDGSPSEFDFQFKVKVNGWCGTVDEKTIDAHYEASGNHEVYLKWLDNYKVLVNEYSEGETFKLPKAPRVEGYKFASYTIGLTEFNVGDEVEMPDETLIVNVTYEVAQKYNVRFYDGDCNLVFEDSVYEGESATEPSTIMRDRFTDTSEYKFVGWNCKFNKIKANLDVFGIYIGIGEE